MSDLAPSSESNINFKDFSHVPNLTPEGVNKDSGFRVGQQNSNDSIQKLTHINGLTITELQNRMRPNSLQGVNPGPISYEGFLGQNESLVDALTKANNIVTENGYTHKDLASWLSNAISAYSNANSSSGKDGKRFQMNGMDFEIKYMGTVSKGQESPFQNPNVKTDEDGWDGSYFLKNITTGRQIDFTPQIPRWISKWGFYEGFDTPFNVNPQNVIDIFNKTDRVYQTREEYISEKINEYKNAGWQNVIIDHPKVTTQSYPPAFDTLKVFRDDFEGEEKISQIISDQNFVVATAGHFTQFRRFENRLNIFDKKSSEILVKCSVYGNYKISKENTDGVESVRVQVFEERTGNNNLDGEIIVNNKPDKNGWTAYHKGDPNYIGDYSKYLSQFGLTSYSSEDQMVLYKSPAIEFLTQKQGEAVVCFYKINKNTGAKERMPLTQDFLKKIGITSGAGEYVSEVSDIRVDANGVVRGTVVANGKSQEFAL